MNKLDIRNLKSFDIKHFDLQVSKIHMLWY